MRPGRADQHPAPWVRAAARLERADGLDRAVAAVGLRVGAVAPGGTADDALRGAWLGHPVHPLLVTATAGLWTGVVLLDALRREEAARALLGAGLLLAVPTLVTGAADWDRVEGASQPRRVGLVHGVVSTAATGLLGVSWLARRAGRHRAGRRWTALGAAAVVVGDYLGGHLVYSQAVGVDRRADEPAELRLVDDTADRG